MSAAAPEMPLEERRLPNLRRDLQFFAGPADHDGSPTFTLFDPVSGQFTKLGYAEAELIRHLQRGMTIGEVVEMMQANTTVRIDAEDVHAFIRVAEMNHLTEGAGQMKGRRFEAVAKSRKQGVFMWLLHHYLYFRVPLIHPDAFLRETVGYFRMLGSRAAITVYLLVAAMGLVMIASRFSDFVYTFPDFLSLRGAAAYGCAMIVIKGIHEFSHAYMARHFGVRVRCMGLAFIVFWPVPFCDVTEAWKLQSRLQRFLIAFAGVGAELVVASFSLFLWCVTPDGPLRSAFFLLSSLTIVSTLLVNLNPAMRFDGYYLLTDLSGVENLQQRAFAMAKWMLRKFFLGLTIAPPEDGVPRSRKAWMLVYSVYTWQYRFFLYLGIAVLVYYEFAKAIGLVLFSAEIYFFIAMPAINEVKNMVRLRKLLTLNPRSAITLGIFAVILLWAALPLPRIEPVTAVVQPATQQPVYADFAAILTRLDVERGQDVKQGDPVVRLESPRLNTEIRTKELERNLLAERLQVFLANEEQTGLIPETQERLAQVNAELQSLRRRAERGRITAQVDGTIFAWDEKLAPGQPVKQGSVLGRIGDKGERVLVAYVEEDYIQDLAVEQSIAWIQSATLRRHLGTVTSISPVSAEILEIPSLSTTAGGDVPVLPRQDGMLAPNGSYYRVEIMLEAQDGALPPAIGQRGFLRLWTRPRSLVLDGLRYAYGVLLRESGF